MESADDEDAVEREVMRDRNAPRFGEQALEPLKARLAVLAVFSKMLLAIVLGARRKSIQKKL